MNEICQKIKRHVAHDFKHKEDSPLMEQMSPAIGKDALRETEKTLLVPFVD